MDPIALDSQTLWNFVTLPLQSLPWIFSGNGQEIALKSILLLLPAILMVVGFWTTLLSLPTLMFRQNRTTYSASILVAWLESLRAVIMYWSGMAKFVFLSVGWIAGGVRIIIMGFLQTIKDIVFAPITIIANLMREYAHPGVPWLAVMITFFWIGLEALIFSFILAPLVGDILSGMTNIELHPTLLSSGLFVFLFMVVGGSLACMHGLVEAIDKRNIASIIKMSFIEIIVASVEVVFFYREFVEAILPFFNRMSDNGLVIGPVFILAIGFVAWTGIRSATWFFFAKYGTPTLLLIISREGLVASTEKNGEPRFPVGKPLSWLKGLVAQLQSEMKWFEKKSQEMADAFFIPPMQTIAVMANFIMLLIASKHLINVPLKSINDVRDTKDLISAIADDKKGAA